MLVYRPRLLLVTCLALAPLQSARAEPRPPATVWSVAFSPDGKFLASAGTDRTIRLWDPATGREVRRLVGHQAEVWSVAFSPDGKRLASGSQDSTIRLWDVASGKLLRRIETRHQGIRSVAFSPDGNTLASGGLDNAVRLWDVATARQLRRLDGHQERVTFVAFSPDGKLLASGSWDNTICLWDSATGRKLRRLEEGLKVIVSIAFGPESTTLVAGSFGANPLPIWNATTGQAVRQLVVPQGFLSFATLSPDGRTIAAVTTGSGREVIHLWDTTTGKERRRFFDLPAAVQCLGYSPDGKRLAAGSLDGTVSLWDLTTGRQLLVLEGSESQSSSAVVLAGHQGPVTSVMFAPDGKCLASASEDRTIRIWDATTGEEKCYLPKLAAAIRYLAFAPDGKTLAAASGNMVTIRNAGTGQEVAQLVGHGSEIVLVAFTPDGQTLISGGRDGTIRLWDVDSGKQLRRFSSFAASFVSLAASNDGQTFAYLGDDGALHLWNRLTERNTQVFKVEGRAAQFPFFATVEGQTARCLIFAPDGKTLAAGDDPVYTDTIRIWEVASRSERQCLSSPASSVHAVAYSHDGKVLALGGSDGAIGFWDVTTAKEVRRLRGLPGPVQSAAFSPDGVTLAAGTGTGLLLVRGIPDLLQEERRPALIFSALELESLWMALAMASAGQAHKAMRTLTAAPAQAVPFLYEHMRKVPEPDMQRIPQLIHELDHNRYGVRRKATEELEKLGDAAEPALREVLRGRPSLEVRRRIERLLQRVEAGTVNPEWVRVSRAVEILEQIGSPQAREVLRALAKGEPEAPLTCDAKAALERLAKRVDFTPRR